MGRKFVMKIFKLFTAKSSPSKYGGIDIKQWKKSVEVISQRSDIVKLINYSYEHKKTFEIINQ